MTLRIDDLPEGIRKTFLEDVADFKLATGVPVTMLCREAAGSPGIVSKLKRGHNVSLATLERLESWMQAYRDALALATERAEREQSLPELA